MAVNLVIVNARVRTGDPRRPWADAIAVEGDLIRVVGSSAEVMKLAAGARVIDAKGALVTPGSALEDGVLRAGTAADLVMRHHDRTAPATQVGDAEVVLAVVGGKIVFER